MHLCRRQKKRSLMRQVYPFSLSKSNLLLSGELPDYQKLRKIGTGKVKAKEKTRPEAFEFRTSKRAEFKPTPVEPKVFTGRRLTSDESMRKALLGHTVKQIAKRECTVPESVSIFCSFVRFLRFSLAWVKLKGTSEIQKSFRRCSRRSTQARGRSEARKRKNRKGRRRSTLD